MCPKLDSVYQALPLTLNEVRCDGTLRIQLDSQFIDDDAALGAAATIQGEVQKGARCAPWLVRVSGVAGSRHNAIQVR